ncbi:LapA family protein [Pseudanabaena galeata UHCC 0370]|jgi:hypothetical protein|uniref:LapA family protein n=1 Tax=Pseudanabaena galeata UHCC 0370 TaxID=3110310 RepID=A0ABU5TF97_9CYAN|nr:MULTISPECIES: LapA family protein [Pseudanabaena]MEA5476936.1 LapA family protein [Pseudanabaena galeata UHCC 0370]MEA5485360.1 LapA family protein [Pseudanabaena sp. CCNP1317]WGS73580.1 LapA family protein [Pseudanabaena galeata CCNP1313]
MIRLSLYIFLWVASMAIAIFATQNTSLVNLKLFSFESIKLPLGLLLIFCAGFGAICITFGQTLIGFELPTVPKFSVFPTGNNASKRQTVVQPSTAKKDVSKTNNRNNNVKDDFDDDWDDDWG